MKLAAQNNIFVSIFLVMFSATSGTRILMTAPQHLSHVLRQLELGSELAKRGHEVYVAVASRFPKQKTITDDGMKVLLYHIPDDILYGVSEEHEILTGGLIYNETSGMPFLSSMINTDCEFMMEDQRFLKHVRSLKFDLAVVEPFIYSQCVLLLPHYLRIPFVSMTTELHPWTFRVPALPSFFRAFKQSTIFEGSSLMGIMENTLLQTIANLGFLYPGVRNRTLLNLYAPDVGSWGELVRESELFLITSDHHLGMHVPAFPNIVTIAGLTCRSAQKLDHDYEEIMSNNRSGIIVMIFGSKAHHMPKDVLEKFLNTFARLNQTIIARLPTTDGLEIPKNVHLMPWIPQNDILGHPNTRLFITHCGTHGLYESLFHGVPMIGFPLFGDQPFNCFHASNKGFGLTMNIRDFTTEKLFNNIQEVLENSKYRMAIKNASQRFKDEPMSPQEKAVFWVEYVMKHGGHHLKSPANDLPLYQFLMLDVVVVVFVGILVSMYLVAVIIRILLRVIFCRRKMTHKSKNN